MNSILLRHLRAFAQRLLPARVDGVRRDGQLDARRQRVAAFPQFLAVLFEHLLVRRRVVEEHADRRAKTALLHGADRSGRHEIHVVEIDRSRMDHLHAGQAGPPVDVLRLQFGLRGPDMVVQPVHQLHVVRIAAQQRHGRMGMAIVEGGHGDGIAAVDDRVEEGRVLRPDVGDAVAFDGDVRTVSVQFNMFDENAHRPAPFSSFDIKPPSSTACQ